MQYKNISFYKKQRCEQTKGEELYKEHQENQKQTTPPFFLKGESGCSKKNDCT